MPIPVVCPCQADCPRSAGTVHPLQQRDGRPKWVHVGRAVNTQRDLIPSHTMPSFCQLGLNLSLPCLLGTLHSSNCADSSSSMSLDRPLAAPGLTPTPELPKGLGECLVYLRVLMPCLKCLPKECTPMACASCLPFAQHPPAPGHCCSGRAAAATSPQAERPHLAEP